jgi:NitT/TauT family transport system substrate-binding protein
MIVLAFFMVIFTAACGGADQAGSDSKGKKDKFEILLSSQHSTFYFPLYIAEGAGFFEEENLDVELIPSKGSGAAVQQLVAGNAQSALPGPASIMIGKSQGNDLKVVYTYLYNDVFGVIVANDSPITDFSQLKGKVLGISEYAGGEVPLVNGLMSMYDLQEGKDVDIIPVGFGAAAVEALTNGTIDAYASSVIDFAIMEAAGYDFRWINPEEATGFPANSFTVQTEELEKNPDVLIRVARAIAKATLFAHTNQDAAVDILAKAIPEEFNPVEDGRAFFEGMLQLAVPPEGVDGVFGQHSVQGWKNYQDFLLAGGPADPEDTSDILKEPVDIESILTEELLEDINDFDRDAVIEKAKNWKK